MTRAQNHRLDRSRIESVDKRTIRAAVYVRISQDRIGAGLGVDRQEPPCADKAARLGWTVVDTYVDNDTSASSSKPRKHWQRLLADIRAGEIDAIVGWHIDRLTRKPRELEDIIDLYEQRGVLLATATGDVDLSTPTGRYMARTLGNNARLEVEHKTERQELQRMQAAKMGRPHITGRRPFGYLDDFVTAHPVEAPIVADAARRVLAGETLGSVARSMNEAGFTTTICSLCGGCMWVTHESECVDDDGNVLSDHHVGNAWNYNGLRQLLKSARISGRREYKIDRVTKMGEIVAVDCWDAIITPEQSDRLRKRLSARSRPSGSTTRKHLLSGLLTCALCGASMAAGSRAAAGGGTYRCNALARSHLFDGFEHGCARVTVQRKHADRHVVDMLLTAIESPDFEQRLHERDEVDPLLAKQVADDEEELLEIARDKVEGRITRGEWLAQREVVDARLTMNRAKLARQTNTDSLALLDEGEGDLRSRWDALNISQQRAIISAVLETVRVAPGTNSGCVFRDERLTPLWRV